MAEKNRKTIADYAEIRRSIRDGDLLLFRPRGWIWRAIAVAGRSEYCHAAMAGWWGGRLMNVEMTSGGGRAQLLSNLVERWPGVIDVYAANATHRRFSREKALSAMIGITGQDYGTHNLFRVAMYHTPVVRFFMQPDTDEEEGSRSKVQGSTWPPFCSQAVSLACRAGGVRPVPHLADRSIEPADLARTTFFKYRFTLGKKTKKPQSKFGQAVEAAAWTLLAIAAGCALVAGVALWPF